MAQIGKSLRTISLTLTLALLLACASSAFAQGTATTIRYGTTLPATCTSGKGQYFSLTAAAPAVGLYSCTATNTWSIVGSANTPAGVAIGLPYGTDTGAANAYVCNPTPAVTLTLGAAFNCKITNSSTSGAATMNASGTGAKSIFEVAIGTSLRAAALSAGVTYQFTYDGTEWILGGYKAMLGGAINLANAQYIFVSNLLDDGNGSTAPVMFVAPNPGPSGGRSPLISFLCPSCGNNHTDVNYDTDGQTVISGNNTFDFAIPVQMTGGSPTLNLQENVVFNGDDLYINPSPGGPKTSGNAIRVTNNSGPNEFAVDSVNGNVTMNGSPFGSNVQYAEAACETSYGATTVSGGATTTTGLNCLPANSIIDAVVYRITTTITTAANFTIGDSGSATRYCGTQSTLTAGTTGTCTAQGYYLNASALGVKFTPNTTPGAGAIRFIVFYHTWTAPTS